MKLLFSVITLSVFIPLQVVAGGENTCVGSRAMALGQAAVSLKEAFALYNNAAGIADIKTPAVFTFYELPYSILSVQRTGAGLVYPYKNICTGISIYNFGNEHYHELRLGAAIAHSIKHVSLGLKVNYYEMAIAQTATRRRCIIEFGGITKLSKHIQVGAHIYNLNQASIGENLNEIPVTMKLGALISPLENLHFTIETEKKGNYNPFIKTGIEYCINKTIAVRTGLSTLHSIIYFGIGVTHKKWIIDYACRTHPLLGLSQSLSILYKLKRKDEK